MRLIWILWLSCAGLAQTVADVHPSKKNDDFYMGMLPNGRFQFRHASLVRLIGTAWGVDGEAVFGGPPWLASDQFDVIMQVPAGSTAADRAPLLRALLAARFGLATHEDRKPLQVLALVQTKRGAQLKQSEAGGAAGCNEDWDNGPPPMDVYNCRGMTMAALAAEMREMDRSVTKPVVDRTGLQGTWDFSIRFTPLFDMQRLAAGGAASPGVKFADALDKIGLRLEAQEAVVPVVAVDRVNRNPTPNAADLAEKMPASPQEFEAAEVKPSPPDTKQSFNFYRGGRVELRGLTLRELMAPAWDLEADRIMDGPKWIDTDRYDVIAKAPAGTPSDDLVPMVKTLIIDRFKLAAHTTDRPVTVYFLTAGKNPKVKESDPSIRSECTISRGATGNGAAAIPLKIYSCRNTTMAQFAELIRPQAAGYIRAPVIDQTGLKGGYDFTLSWTRADIGRAAQGRSADEGGASDPVGVITVFDAVEKQLGLKLEGGKKHPLPVLVIDRVERVQADR
jgi:uncharacterized protein (TIGR03435 family)